jgi:hypothetical protein
MDRRYNEAVESVSGPPTGVQPYLLKTRNYLCPTDSAAKGPITAAPLPNSKNARSGFSDSTMPCRIQRQFRLRYRRKGRAKFQKTVFSANHEANDCDFRLLSTEWDKLHLCGKVQVDDWDIKPSHA